jgi:hypothetical protein
VLGCPACWDRSHADPSDHGQKLNHSCSGRVRHGGEAVSPKRARRAADAGSSRQRRALRCGRHQHGDAVTKEARGPSRSGRDAIICHHGHHGPSGPSPHHQPAPPCAPPLCAERGPWVPAAPPARQDSLRRRRLQAVLIERAAAFLCDGHSPTWMRSATIVLIGRTAEADPWPTTAEQNHALKVACCHIFCQSRTVILATTFT